MAAKKKKKLMMPTVETTLMPILPLDAGAPDATTWVMRGQNGMMQRVKVADMSDSHVFRWIQYFRRKFRENEGDPAVTTEVIDSKIKAAIITATAIYAEAAKRSIPVVPPPSLAPAPDVAQGYGGDADGHGDDDDAGHAADYFERGLSMGPRMAAAAMPGQVSLFRGKVRAPVSITLTPAHHAKVRKAMERLGITRADLLGLLIDRYADTVKI